MIDELANLVKTFPSEAMHIRCFAHVINLVVKSILKQFDLPDKKKNKILNEGLRELRALGADLEVEEQMRDRDDADDNVGGWVDEHKEMTEEKLEELENQVLPVRKVLVKVG